MPMAAAKRMAYGTLDIDMVAGPSEVLVIADESADPKYVAADLLARRNMTSWLPLCSLQHHRSPWPHGWMPKSSVRPAIWAVQSIIAASLRDFGCAIVCRDLKQAAELANEVAPEHLEIVTEDPRSLLPDIQKTGAVFLGAWSPEPLGDYLAGPDHVLPHLRDRAIFRPFRWTAFSRP